MKTAARSTPATRSGFTLIELLTVIAIIAILAAIMVPTVTTAVTHVKKAKTAVQLSQLVTMSRMYKTQYGVWPTFATPQTSSDTAFSLDENKPRFVRIMTGYPTGPDLVYNKYKMAFANFGESDLTADPESVTPVDPFKNTDLYLVFNTNLSRPGQIAPSAITGISMLSYEGLQITVNQDPTVNIYSDCVGLSPGVGLTNTDAITTFTVTQAP